MCASVRIVVAAEGAFDAASPCAKAGESDKKTRHETVARRCTMRIIVLANEERLQRN
jgi:hypothetical protein